MKAGCCAMGLLSVALCAPVLGKDVTLYRISKGFHHQQTLSAPPTTLTENGYVFEAEVFLALPGTVASAMVESIEGTDRVLTLEGDDQFEFRNRVNSRNTLDSRYPEGPFTMTINAITDGGKVVSLPLTGNTYPNAPNIMNLWELQSINAHGYAVVRWEAFAGGTSRDFIQLRIEDSEGDRAFETRDFGEIGALDGSATYVILDPNTLKPGATYEATLRFDQTSTYDNTSYLGVPGLTTHHALTRFTIATSFAGAPDAKSYTLSKGRRFDQTTAALPEPDLADEFIFSAEVKSSAADSVTNVLMSPPVGEAIMLFTQPTESTYTDRRGSQALLDAAYPNGTYGFSIETVLQGTRAVSLPLNGDAYPPVPHLSNFDPSQPVRADRNLIFEWDPWTDGIANDFVQFRIEDNNDKLIFETEDFGETGALHGRATWTMVPGGTLEPEKTYRARLAFTRLVALDTTTYPGALGTATYYSRTKFAIVTGPPDVSSFRIAKGREHTQTDPTTVVPNERYVFTALVAAASTGVVQSVSLNVPGRGTTPLTRQADGQTFSLSETHNSMAALDTAFPDGTYQLAMRGVNDGLRSVSVELDGGGYPAAPLINEYEATGQIFAWFDFIITWAPFEGGRSRDFILLEVLDRNGGTIYSTGDYRRPGSMGGLNTAVWVPAEWLQANALYAGRVTFERVNPVDENVYPGVLGRGGYFSSTRWPMATLGDGNPTTFKGWSLAADGKLEFVFPSIAGGIYMIEGSPDLANWTRVASVEAVSEQTIFRTPIPTGASHYFYRAAFTR